MSFFAKSSFFDLLFELLYSIYPLFVAGLLDIDLSARSYKTFVFLCYFVPILAVGLLSLLYNRFRK